MLESAHTRRPLTYAGCILLACVAAMLAMIPVFGQTAVVTLVGAGDIASCSQTNDSATARLLGNIPGTVFTLGDNVYPSGTADRFRNCYDPTWGRYKARTKPTLGNHDYTTNGASAYFDYFRNQQTGARGKGYYSYDRGAWHIVALNSNCDRVSCSSTSAQAEWLRSDLAAHSSQCTLAYWHEPLYASGTGSDEPRVRTFWNILFRHDAEVILAGHAHRYERYAKLTPGGARSANGIRQFIVGTGGEPGGTYNGPDHPDMQVMKRNTPGVLKLNLRTDSYTWKFVPIASKTFTDSGSNRCH